MPKKKKNIERLYGSRVRLHLTFLACYEALGAGPNACEMTDEILKGYNLALDQLEIVKFCPYTI